MLIDILSRVIISILDPYHGSHPRHLRLYEVLPNSTKPVNSKRFATLDEIRHIYDHYEEILAGTKTSMTLMDGEAIAGLTAIFLLETKNWERSGIEIKSDKPIQQIQRVDTPIENTIPQKPPIFSFPRIITRSTMRSAIQKRILTFYSGTNHAQIINQRAF